ncbi:MAG: transposase [Deltaproteobacteria bacterium]|nr:transposase [Deltaproteobacteria bacterium]
MPKSKGGKRGKRYSADEKASLLARYGELRQSGKKIQEAAKAVGVSYITLHNWEKKKSKPGRKPGPSARVQTTATRRPRGQILRDQPLTLVTPSGYRIEGITPRDLIQVLKAIG